MEADAFQVLSRYLESLNDTYRNTDGGKEIVEDIEARIAELILSHQDNSKVVELSLVEEIIAQMGSAEAIREQEGREAPRGEGRIPRRLYRDMDQARLGGVYEKQYSDRGKVCGKEKARSSRLSDYTFRRRKPGRFTA